MLLRQPFRWTLLYSYTSALTGAVISLVLLPSLPNTWAPHLLAVAGDSGPGRRATPAAHWERAAGGSATGRQLAAAGDGSTGGMLAQPASPGALAAQAKATNSSSGSSGGGSSSSGGNGVSDGQVQAKGLVKKVRRRRSLGQNPCFKQAYAWHVGASV